MSAITTLLKAIPPQFKVPNVTILTSTTARVVAVNPHAMTLGGSNTYLLGREGSFDVSGSDNSNNNSNNNANHNKKDNHPSVPLADDSPLLDPKRKIAKNNSSSACSESSSSSSGYNPLILVDSGEGKPLYAPLINYVMRYGASNNNNKIQQQKKNILAGIFLTHWHGDHVGGVCDVLMDCHNTLLVQVQQQKQQSTITNGTFSSSSSYSVPFAIFKKDGLVMSNQTLHELLSKQLSLKIQQRLAFIDEILSVGDRAASLTDSEKEAAAAATTTTTTILFDIRRGGNDSTASSSSSPLIASIGDEERWQFASKHYMFPLSSSSSAVADSESLLSSSSSPLTYIDGIPAFFYDPTSSSDINSSSVIPLSRQSILVERTFLIGLQQQQASSIVPPIIDPSDMSATDYVNGKKTLEIAGNGSNDDSGLLTIGGGGDTASTFSSTVTYRTAVAGDSTHKTVKQIGVLSFGSDSGSANDTKNNSVAVLTSPGHTDDHTVLYLMAPSEKTLITADTVLGSFMAVPSEKNPSPAPVTTAFTCYSDYMMTLGGLSSSSSSSSSGAVVTVTSSSSSASAPLSVEYILPGHGTAIPEHCEKRVDYYIAHRLKREAQVLEGLQKWCSATTASSCSSGDDKNSNNIPKRSPSLAKAAADGEKEEIPFYGPTTAAGLVDAIYQNVIPAGSHLVTAAQNNVLHILRKLYLQEKISIWGPNDNVTVGGSSSSTSSSATAEASKDPLVLAFLAEEDYPKQLYVLQGKDAPSEDAMLREVYASLGGGGESPPPQQPGADSSSSATNAERYSTELVWKIRGL